MKKYKFEIIFCDGRSIIVYSFNENEAKILAQAQRINQGKDIEILKWERWEK